MEHVVLVGMMGAGKTTVGKILSRLTTRGLVDTDVLIERSEGMDISGIIDSKGEEYFRMVERNVVLSIDLRAPLVIATGGGAVMDDEVHAFLKNIGKTVYIRASAGTLYGRTSNPSTRPLLRDGDRLETIKRLIEKREKRYLDSDVVIESDDRSPLEIANEIVRELGL
ncbi:MAG: shikimate kinase [Deltaproteobacteria bacterium]|nr:shikimate kinase [Deltaproteobacteria bacterium]MCL5276967.1 shikimate kinase [Deltaproteobacteria bacterium]